MAFMPDRNDAKTQRLDREALDQLSRAILTSAFRVHSRLGPGLLESVYRVCLAHELRKEGLRVAAEQLVPVVYDDDLSFDHAYRLDLLVEGELIVEVKAVQAILPVHLAQLLSYLRLSDRRLGLLLNFHAPRLQQGIRRVVNNFYP